MSERLGSPGTPVVVTGGASGIGREVCRALAEVGRSVAPWDLNGAGAKAVADECAAEFGVATSSLEVDVRDPDAINAGVDPTIAALGGVGGLVHAAGISMAPSATPARRHRVRHRAPGEPAGRSHAGAGVPARAAGGATGVGDRGHRVDRRA